MSDIVNARAREAILGGLRTSLKSGPRFATGPQRPAAPPAAPTLPEPDDRAALLARFDEELRQLGGRLIACPRERSLPLILELLRERHVESALTWNPESLPLPNLPEALRGTGMRLVGEHVPIEEPARSRQLREMAGAGVGVTGAEAALAEAGTLVVRSGPGRGRLASLIAPVHLAIITVDQLYPSFADYLAAQPAEEITAASNVVLITGPSRTADIEMTLTIGVHGPKEVVVVCLTE